MRPILLLIAFGLASITNAAEMRYSKPITLPPFEAEELVAVPLDSDVYAASRENYVDLRLLDSKQADQAYIVQCGQTMRSRKVQQSWQAEKLALKPLDGGGLEIQFEVDPQRHSHPPQGIRFLSPLVNFEHHVKVETSTDGESWETLVPEGLIFDYSQFMDVRNLTLELPAIDGSPKYYRLTIADVTQEQQSQLMELSRSLEGDEEKGRTERVTINRQPFRIDRIELWIDEVRQDVLADSEVEYAVSLEHTEQDTKTKQTILLLKSRREPLTEISVVTPARNFSRSARVEVPTSPPGPDRTWESIAETNLSRIDFRSLKRQSLTFRIPEIRVEEFRIVIDNHDNPPLEITGVKGRGHVYEAIFLASADGKYDLAYGGKTVDRPNYDTAAITASLAEGFKPLIATLGTAVESALPPEPERPLLKRLLNDTRFVTLVIGVLVLLLAAGLYRATRNLDELNDTPK